LCIVLFIGFTNKSASSQAMDPSVRISDYKEFEIITNAFSTLLNNYAHPIYANDLFLESVRGVIDLNGMNEIFNKRGISIQLLSSNPIKTFKANMTENQIQNELERIYVLCIHKNPHLKPIQIAERMVVSMIKSLDDNCYLYNPEAYNQLLSDTSRTYAGIGINIT
jgi:hypothetical protein